MFADYENYDAIGLVELMRKGHVSMAEVVDAAIERAEARNPALNAIVTPTFEAARKTAAAAPTGPLAGVPFLVKDLTMLEGVRCSMGSRLFADFVPDHDATIVKRYRDAGLVILGKTNTPEVGLAATTEGVFLGPCHNPWKSGHTPGGSSGGAASAVAGGIVPVAHATDGGGSIRIPASCCGLVGLKPTRGRTPLGPDVGEGWGGMSVGHVVSRTVRDSAAFLDATHGPSPGDPYHAPHFDGSFGDVIEDAPRGLRIALNLTPTSGGVVTDENAVAAREVAKLCADLGHVVEEATPDIEEEFSIAVGTLVAANVANSIFPRAEALGVELSRDVVEHVTLRQAEIGRQITANLYAKATHTIHRAGRSVAAFMLDYDLILSPTLLCPPVEIGWLNPNSDDLDEYGVRFANFWGFTNLQNATGQPAITLPLARSANGLPIGVQFAARFGDEATLLRIARQLEVAAPWPQTAPM